MTSALTQYNIGPQMTDQWRSTIDQTHSTCGDGCWLFPQCQKKMLRVWSAGQKRRVRDWPIAHIVQARAAQNTHGPDRG